MKIRLIFLNGQELSVTNRELRLLLSSKYVVPYYAASLVYMWAVELYYFLPAVPLSLDLARNFSIVISTLFVFLVSTHLLIRVQILRNKLLKAHLSILFLSTNIVVNILLFNFLKVILNQEISYLNMFFVILNNIFVTEIVLFIFSVYTLPLINNTLNDQKISNDMQNDTISISGTSIRPDTIMYIKSDDAYLHIITSSDNLHVRGNISDYAKMLKRFGVLTHRSFWINPKHAHSVYKEGTTLKYIKMNDNIKIPVAKSRSVLVEQNLLERNP